MKIKVEYFGRLTDLTQLKNEELYIPEGSSSDFAIHLIKTKYPELANTSFQIALNASLTKSDKPLKDNDSIALLPPFSGG